MPSYLRPTQYGVRDRQLGCSSVATSNYDAVRAAALESAATPSTANWGSIDEDVTALFTQVNGDVDIGEQRLRYNVGVRWVETDQLVTSRSRWRIRPTPTLPDGAEASGSGQSSSRARSTYENWLPSANVSWNLTDNAIVRAGLSKTMTRANPTDMLLGLSIRNADVSQVDLGNPGARSVSSRTTSTWASSTTPARRVISVSPRSARASKASRSALSQTVAFGDLAQYGVTLETLGQQQRDAVNARGGNSALVELRQTVNASGRLTINGLEFNWVQPLDFLLSGIGLDGLGFTANYTIIDQKGQGAAPAIAIGVPPESYNATLYYDKHGISARVSVTHSQGSQGSGPNSNQIGRDRRRAVRRRLHAV